MKQRIYTQTQQKWLTKLMGYNFEITYKKGSENIMVDALSLEFSLIAISIVNSKKWGRIQDSWKSDAEVAHIIEQLQKDSQSKPNYVWEHNQLKSKGSIVVKNDPRLRQQLFLEFHCSSIGGHSVAEVTKKEILSFIFIRRDWKKKSKTLFGNMILVIDINHKILYLMSCWSPFQFPQAFEMKLAWTLLMSYPFHKERA